MKKPLSGATAGSRPRAADKGRLSETQLCPREEAVGGRGDRRGEGQSWGCRGHVHSSFGFSLWLPAYSKLPTTSMFYFYNQK